MKKLSLVVGTRPEAVKKLLLANELKSREGLKTVVCTTGQHRQLLDQVLDLIHAVLDYDLFIMTEK